MTKIKNVGDIMSPTADYVASSTSLRDAARKMKQLNCGFLPISDASGNCFEGVITDRDIVVRAIAETMDPGSTTVGEIKTDRVLQCFRTDSLETAARIMAREQVYRLLVLEDENDKRLCGVISLNDIVRHDEHAIAMATAREIAD
jgi:CBS domain-containing protein